MNGKMKVWVVNHPFEGRKWCKARIREAGSQLWQTGFAWAEWNGPFREEDPAIVPLMPDSDRYSISNVDPLVFGPRMYFDYCKKGRLKPEPMNLRPPNELKTGDLVLFACRKDDRIFLDTVFAIGKVKRWPEGRQSVPAWRSVGRLAKRVHYHPFALKQHPEVHNSKVRARSYRGGFDADDGQRYSWVPWAKSVPSAPLAIDEKTPAFEALQAIYEGKELLDGFTGSFGVVSCKRSDGARLFEQLLRLAKGAGFGAAAELDLPSDERVPYEDREAGALACGGWKHADAQEVQVICGEKKT